MRYDTLFPYATAYAVVWGRRHTLTMCRVHAKPSMD